jgi:ATP-dependent DNA helicase RecG
MQVQTLQQLVEQGESDRLEFKRTTGERVEAAKTVCAMLNGVGGIVLFGVRADGTIEGQDLGERTLDELSNEWQKFEPPAFPELSAVPLDSGKSIIRIGVTGGGAPFTDEGRPCLRNGATTIRMPPPRYQELLLERMHATHRWENQIADGFDVTDLDVQEILRTIEESIRRGRLDDPQRREIPALLTGLGLVHQGHLTNAAVVLFGKLDRLLGGFPQCLVRMARFKGTDRSEFIDNRQEIGNAFTLLLRAQRFLRDHLPVAGRIVPGVFERIDEPLYPIEALREALANAICHHDYGMGGGSIGVAIYDDRLEISSTGRLPFGLTPDDLLVPHESRRRNPLIAEAFYRRGIIERWGRGTLKMIELTTEAGLRAPEFEERSGEVIVRFKPNLPEEFERGEISRLPLIQQTILDVLRRQGPLPARKIQQEMEHPVPGRTLRENLAALREQDLVVMVGVRRNAQWALKSEANED